MDRARDKLVWCPHVDFEIPLLMCLNKPTKRQMVKMFEKGVADGIRKKDPFVLLHKLALLQLIEELNMRGKMPDKDWL